MKLEDLEEKLGIRLDSWQREFVLEQHPMLILKCGRKVGKTFAMGIKVVLDSINESFEQTDGIIILSKGHRQSSNVFETVLGFLHKAEIPIAVSYTHLTLPTILRV